MVAMTTNECVVTVSTNRNTVFGWDTRLDGLNNAYHFQSKPSDGIVSSLVVADNGLCVVLGSSLGKFSVWDLRFLMPVKSFAPPVHHSTSKFKVPAVHKLRRHPFDRESVVASMRGHLEISVWKLESGSRSKIFWSSPNAPLDYQGSTHNYAMGFYVSGTSDSDLSIISGGSDKRIRYWDVSNSSNCDVISNCITPPGIEQTFHYDMDRIEIGREQGYSQDSQKRHSLLDNSEYVDVVRESMNETQRQVMFKRGPELPSFSHRDLVTDINVVQGRSGTSYLLSSDMSGAIKVWK